ncbi:MAG: phosphoribosylglycinamide formyltransferase-1 [Bacteriovoracaceae bacterium]
MRVGLISYQTGHLKTKQLIEKILPKGFDITVFAMPFIHRTNKTKRASDRPDQLIDLDIKSFCEERGVEYLALPGWSDDQAHNFPLNFSYYLTCTAKIIPESFIRDRVIINAHPGMLPENRGLDALKRSIIKPSTVGVSIHAINSDIDSGILLHREAVPIYDSDTFSDVANRVYELELELQTNADLFIKRLENKNRLPDGYDLSKSRVSKVQDANIEQIFQKNKQELIRLSRLEVDKLSK